MVTDPAGPNIVAAPESPCVLVADDSTEVQETLRSQLSEAGYRVFCVGSGTDAVRLIRQRSLDAVITEIILPNGDGLELISALKRYQPTVPVIAYSGGGRYLSSADCLRVARGFGAYAALAKPATREQIVELVGQAVAAPVGRVARVS